jgi:two-component system, NarL family, sensor histidine kinase UhpB
MLTSSDPCNILPMQAATEHIPYTSPRSAQLLPGQRTATPSSLRVRLIISIAIVLAMILVPGSLLVYWHAVHKVQIEVRAAVAVGTNIVHNAVDDAEEATSPLRRLELLIADFDGDRHLRVVLVDPAGTRLYQSSPLKPAEPAPDWFYRLLARSYPSTSVALPAPFARIGHVVLEPDAHNEISEVWDDTVVTLLLLALFCGMNAGLVYWITGHALRPLETISAAFARLGSGNYRLRIPELGPREMVQVSNGLNQLARQLQDAESRRLQLEQQLAAVQEEERADLARDLHDEIGPLLFAVGIDLSVIQHDKAIEDTSVPARIGSVRESIARIYSDIKRILERLRSGTPSELGLGRAIENLVSFWRMRYPAIEFCCAVPGEGFGEATDDAIYHIIMESLSNALRHGSPTLLDVSVAAVDGVIRVIIRDNGGGFSSTAGRRPGFGLTSMEQRVKALRGSLSVTTSSDGGGVAVVARIPESASETEQPKSSVVSVLP